MPNSRRLLLTLSCMFSWTLLGALSAHAQTAIATVGVGTGPSYVAVNPVTNKIYVANYNNIPGKVTVVDGANNSTTTVSAGTNPFSVAVNPVTNKKYATDMNRNKVTVTEG